MNGLAETLGKENSGYSWKFEKVFLILQPIRIIMSNSRTTHTEDGAVIASEPVASYPMTSYADAMAMIHTMHLSRADKERVGRRLVLETTESNLSKAFDSLEHFMVLEAGWAGEGSLPVSRSAINNLRKVLLLSDDDDWKYWMISPESNGAISLQSKLRRSSISVGSEEYSYYTKVDGQRKGKSHVSFDANNFLSVMREIVK